MDLISVLIPAFNAEPYIGITLSSVVAQTDPCFEVLVVDDGSTDRTREIVREFAPRVRLIEQRNCGPATARNLLLSEATGQFVAFLDADDVWNPTKLAFQRRLFEEHPEVVLVAAQLRGIDAASNPIKLKEDSRFLGLFDRPLHMHRALLKTGNMIGQSTVVAKRDVVLAAGGWYSKERILSTDYELWIRLAERGPFFVSSDIVGDYRVLPGSLSHRSVAEEYKGQQRIIDMYRSHFTASEYNTRISKLYDEWAESAFYKGDSDGWHVWRQAISLDPLNLRAWKVGAKQALVSLFRPALSDRRMTS
jgi:glycosyltransferase involved in cell wall biosynthesis